MNEELNTEPINTDEEFQFFDPEDPLAALIPPELIIGDYKNSKYEKLEWFNNRTRKKNVGG